MKQLTKTILYFLGGFVFISAISAGYFFWRKTQTKPVEPAGENIAKYIDFKNNYLFSIPDKYAVDGTAMTGITLVYPIEMSSLGGNKLEKLYKSGVVAVEPITELKDNNIKAFQDYAKDTLAVELREELHCLSDVRPVKQNDIEAIKVFALASDGKRLRAVYTLNLSQPIKMTAQEESDALKVVGSTMEDLKTSKSKPDIDRAVQVAEDTLKLMQNQDVAGLRKKGTTEFQRNETTEELTTTLKESALYFDQSVTIAGGSYDGKLFIAQLIFEPKTTNGIRVGGVISLSKQGEEWKLEGFQLSQL